MVNINYSTIIVTTLGIYKFAFKWGFIGGFSCSKMGQY